MIFRTCRNHRHCTTQVPVNREAWTARQSIDRLHDIVYRPYIVHWNFTMFRARVQDQVPCRAPDHASSCLFVMTSSSAM